MKVLVDVKTTLSVELDIDNFDDLNQENMSFKESDKIIKKAIANQYGIIAKDIRVVPD